MQSKVVNSSRHRRGISFVELVGFLMALAGGIVLGLIYLGVDVQATAVDILEKADIDVAAMLNSETTDHAAMNGGHPQEDCSAIKVESEPTDASEWEASVPSLAIPTAETNDDVDVEPAAREELTDAQKKLATQECWAALDACVRQESANRSKAIRRSGDWQLFDYLLHRKEGHEQTVELLEEIDEYGVDQRVVIHLQQVLAWHRSGQELFDRATHLLTSAPAGKLTGPFAQSWQSAATQHRMEEKLILNKHASIATYLEHAKRMSNSDVSQE